MESDIDYRWSLRLYFWVFVLGNILISFGRKLDHWSTDASGNVHTNIKFYYTPACTYMYTQWCCFYWLTKNLNSTLNWAIVKIGKCAMSFTVAYDMPKVLFSDLFGSTVFFFNSFFGNWAFLKSNTYHSCPMNHKRRCSGMLFYLNLKKR